MIKEQEKLIKELDTIVEIFKGSECTLRPHFILTGGSGTGKSHTIQTLAAKHDIAFVEVNGAGLTKEGTAGNSISKALAPLGNLQGAPAICFVDEFDKLFISGNSNDSAAHETTNGVQNEFLTVLETDHTSVFGAYGKYDKIEVSNVLFIFAGAFNGAEDVTLDDLREFGVKTEFLGRVGLVFNTEKLSLESLLYILDNSEVLSAYLDLFSDVVKEEVTSVIGGYIKDNYEQNTLGVRMINNLIHQYFIKGGKLGSDAPKKVTFQKSLQLK